MRTIDGIRTGPIADGQALKGLCDRVAIQVRRVFDGCVTRLDREQFDAHINDFSFDPVPPLRFVSATSSGEYITVSGLDISESTERGLSRVVFETQIPTTIVFEDSTGRQGTARATLSQNFDLLMRVPNTGFQSFSVESEVNLEALKGRFEGLEFIVLTCCVAAITRIVGNVDLIVPAYGTVEFDECDSNGGCEAFFDTPFFSSFGN